MERTHDEESPLLGKRSSTTEVPVAAVVGGENNRMWKYALVAVGLSALGLIATSTSMGGNFHITSFDSANVRGSPANTPPLVANTPPLLSGTQSPVPLAGGPLPVAEEIPSDITDVLVRVSEPKVFDVESDNTKPNVNGPAAAASSSSSAKSLPLQSSGKMMKSSSPNVMTSSNDLNIGNVLVQVEKVGEEEEDVVTTSESTTASASAAATVVLPGSPDDPKLAVERAKKVQAVEVIEEVVEEAAVAAAVEEEAAVEAAASVVPVAKEQKTVIVKGEQNVVATEETTDTETSTTEEMVTETKTGGKHGSKTVVETPEKPTEESTTVTEEETIADVVSPSGATVEVSMPAYIPTAITSTEGSRGQGANEQIVPESLSYEFVYNKLSPNNYPFLIHYRYSDNSCTNMVAAEGYSLDVCFAAKVNGKSFFQKSVAWVTIYDTGMFTYYYTDNECKNLVKDINEIKENPAVLQYRTECFVSDDASPGRAAIVSATDVRTLQYEKLGLPATSSVVVGNYGNDQCMVPTTFTWQRTDICYNDEMYKCDGSLGHKVSYSAGTKCAGSFKGTDLPFKIAECLDTATYGLVSDNNFQMSNCWDVAALPVVADVVTVEDVTTVDVEDTVAENKPWWKFW